MSDSLDKAIIENGNVEGFYTAAEVEKIASDHAEAEVERLLTNMRMAEVLAFYIPDDEENRIEWNMYSISSTDSFMKTIEFTINES